MRGGQGGRRKTGGEVLRRKLIVQRAKSTKEGRRNGGGGEMVRVMDQIPFTTTFAMKGTQRHTNLHLDFWINNQI
jgi:hypothetical protein